MHSKYFLSSKFYIQHPLMRTLQGNSFDLLFVRRALNAMCRVTLLGWPAM